MELLNKFRESPLLKQTIVAWSNMSKGRRVLLSAVIFLLVGGLAWVAIAGSTVDYRALTNEGTDIQQVASIRETLDEAGTPYRLGASGIIEVPSEHYHRARLDLGMEGLLTEGVMGQVRGDELFDEQDSFFVSTAQVEINRRRALEGELSRTVSALDEVRAARVHLVVPKRSLFKDPSRKPSASVVVQLKPAANLTVRRIRGLQKLIASAVEGLEENRVSVIDSTGAILTRDDSEEGVAGQGRRLEMQRSVERDLERRVVSLLEPMAGPGRVIARATVKMDFSATQQTVEEYAPEGIIRSQREITETRGSSKPQAKGVPGARGNKKDRADEDVAQESAKRKDKLTNFDLAKTVTHHSQPPGAIERISVAVVLDGSQREGAAAANTEGNEEEGESANSAYVPFTDEEIVKFDTLVKSAIGFDLRRGDLVHVTNMPFSGVEEELLIEEPLFPPALMRRIMDWGFVMVLLLVSWFLLFRPLLRRLGNKATAMTAVAATAGGPPLLAGVPEKESGSDTAGELSPAELAANQINDNASAMTAIEEKSGEGGQTRVPAQLAQNLRARAIELSRSNAQRSAQVIRTWLQVKE